MTVVGRKIIYKKQPQMCREKEFKTKIFVPDHNRYVIISKKYSSYEYKKIKELSLLENCCKNTYSRLLNLIDVFIQDKLQQQSGQLAEQIITTKNISKRIEQVKYILRSNNLHKKLYN